MALSRGSFVRGRQSRTRRRPSWNGGPDGTLSRTTSGSTLFGTGAQTVVDEITLIRTRGILSLQVTAADAVLAGFDGAVGICVVSENAFNAGIASVPTPATDIAWDGWLWHHIFSIRAVTATIADGVNAVAVHRTIEIDSKAMRKTNITDVIIAVLEATEMTSATLHARIDIRILTK